MAKTPAQLNVENLNTWIRWGRRIIAHPRLWEGYYFQPRCYPSALRVQKKVRRALLGRGEMYRGFRPSHQRPRTVAEKRRIQRKRSRRLLRGIA